MTSLLSSPTGHLTNLSTAAPRVADVTARMRLYNDNVVILRVAENIIRDDGAGGGTHPITLTFNLPIEEYARLFYSVFDDAFDFLMFIANVDENVPDRGSLNFYSPMRNDVEGIGLQRFYDNTYGSAERLKGVLYFSSNHITGRYHPLPYGPSLHEIMHKWANFLVPTALGGHWGFSSANGQLGGFDNATLQDLGDGRYAADFGKPGRAYSPIELYLAGYLPPEDLGDGRYAADFNIGGNARAYSPIELYLAGYLPPEEVPDLLVAEGAEWVKEEGRIAKTSEGYHMFTAERWRTYTIDDIVALDGPRVPAWSES